MNDSARIAYTAVRKSKHIHKDLPRTIFAARYASPHLVRVTQSALQVFVGDSPEILEAHSSETSSSRLFLLWTVREATHYNPGILDQAYVLYKLQSHPVIRKTLATMQGSNDDSASTVDDSVMELWSSIAARILISQLVDKRKEQKAANVEHEDDRELSTREDKQLQSERNNTSSSSKECTKTIAVSTDTSSTGPRKGHHIRSSQ